ncbi:uncharacterized protein V6R79_015354 [Siganus canaliculatus]
MAAAAVPVPREKRDRWKRLVSERRCVALPWRQRRSGGGVLFFLYKHGQGSCSHFTDERQPSWICSKESWFLLCVSSHPLTAGFLEEGNRPGLRRQGRCIPAMDCGAAPATAAPATGTSATSTSVTGGFISSREEEAPSGSRPKAS